jgi:hypothetical protein
LARLAARGEAHGGNSFEYRHPARAQACRVQKWGTLDEGCRLSDVETDRNSASASDIPIHTASFSSLLTVGEPLASVNYGARDPEGHRWWFARRSLPCRGTKVCAANDYEGARDHTGARIYVVARRARRLLDGVIVGRVP